MSNLNDMNIPPDADAATDWAVRREFGLRYDSYREAKLWRVTEPYNLIRPLVCADLEGEWVKDQMREAYDLSDPKHPDFHSIHADLYDLRCCK